MNSTASISIHVLLLMVITDEMDAVLLRQRSSDENSWQTKERAKKDFSRWLNHEHMRTQTVWNAGTGMIRLGNYSLLYIYAPFNYHSVLTDGIVHCYWAVRYTVADPCEAVVEQKLLHVATGCPSSVLVLRVTTPTPLLIMQGFHITVNKASLL